jgi:hypothetical protein
MGLGVWENGCILHPLFEVSNLPFLIEFGDFTFFEFFS